MSTDSASKASRNVPREKAFYFFTSVGNYTGMSAASLKEFMDRVNDVNAKSLEFHLQRGDFEKWVEDVLQDKDLALEIKRMQRFNLMGDALRNQLRAVVSRLYTRLAAQGSSLHS
ncbi:DUF5752 family protein [Candidatus Bathyarchaeota archaeon]|nr:DUF5752 family protein [Candidatus Bathyarchaeota archaeon]